MTTEGPEHIHHPARAATTGAASAVLGAAVGAAGASMVWSHPHGPRSGTSRTAAARPGRSACICSSARTPPPRWWCPGTPPTAVSNPRVMLGTPTSGFGRTVAAETRTYRDAKSSTEVRVNHARLTNLTPDTDYVYAAVHDGTTPSWARCAPRRPGENRCASPVSATSPPRRWSSSASGGYGTDNIGSPAAGRHHGRDRATGPAVQPGQRRPVLRQPRRRPHPHLVGLVREQHPLGALPAVDAGSRQPRERIRQRANRLRRVSDRISLARFRVQPGNPRPVVLVHRRLGAGDQPQQRRCRLPGRRQLLRARLLGRRAKALAGNRTRRRAARPATSIGWWCACTRRRSPPPTQPTAPTWGSARNGCRCSTSTRSIWWCAATNTTTNVTPGARDTGTPKPERRFPSTPAPMSSTPRAGTVHLVIGGGGTSLAINALFFPQPQVPRVDRRRRRSIRRSGARRRYT